MRKTRLMTLSVVFALIAVCGLIVFCTSGVARAGSQITFADSRLERAVREALGIAETEPITREMALTLTFLDASSRGIERLDGLEYFTNLTDLNLSNNKVQVVVPVSALRNLARLSLWDNYINEIGSLSSNTNLTWLDLGANFIENIDALAELANLEWLNLENNFVSDIAPLAELANLQWLNILNNMIENISALDEIPGLAWLNNLPWTGGDGTYLDQIRIILENGQEWMDNWRIFVDGFADLPRLGELSIVPYWQGGQFMENVGILNDYWSARLDLWSDTINGFRSLADDVRPLRAGSFEGSSPENANPLAGNWAARLQEFRARIVNRLGSWSVFSDQPWSSYRPGNGNLRQLWETYLSNRTNNNNDTRNTDDDDENNGDDGDDGDDGDNGDTGNDPCYQSTYQGYRP
ncbi:MAG: hypothetical protein AB1611_13940 [bacterium]